MERHIFVMRDKTGRQIRLTQNRWSHIVLRHPEIGNKIEGIKQTLTFPEFKIADRLDPHLWYYHTFIKEERLFLVVSVKYLNGDGFIITAFYSKNRKR